MAPNKKGEIILNFNNNFDPEVLQKLSKLLSSAKGNELKQQLGSLDKDALLKKFSQLNISHNDINGITEKIKNLSNEDIFNLLIKMRGE